MFKNTLVAVIGSLLVVGCSTTGSKTQTVAIDRKVIETSYRSGQEPAWLSENRTAWDESGEHFIRSTYTINGQQRLNACYDLAKAEAKEALVTEIANQINGEIVRASNGMDEGQEGLSKTWIEKFEGDTRGLRFTETVYERVLVNDVERVECFVLGKITKSDLASMKSRILSKAAKENTGVQKLLDDRQSRLLTDGQSQPQPEEKKQ